jgi:hypothetical protein
MRPRSPQPATSRQNAQEPQPVHNTPELPEHAGSRSLILIPIIVMTTIQDKDVAALLLKGLAEALPARRHQTQVISDTSKVS